MKTHYKIGSKRDIEVIEFNHDVGMQSRAWLLYFEGFCNDSNKSNIWKIQNVQRFLKVRALILYINTS